MVIGSFTKNKKRISSEIRFLLDIAIDLSNTRCQSHATSADTSLKHRPTAPVDTIA
jgi:hypothetical protein